MTIVKKFSWNLPSSYQFSACGLHLLCSVQYSSFIFRKATFPLSSFNWQLKWIQKSTQEFLIFSEEPLKIFSCKKGCKQSQIPRTLSPIYRYWLLLWYYHLFNTSFQVIFCYEVTSLNNPYLHPFICLLFPSLSLFFLLAPEPQQDPVTS